MISPDSIWQHIKTGNIYLVLGNSINCTNAQDGQMMIRYMELSFDPRLEFVRLESEFVEKFRQLSEPPR
jgi:hypothetical protein